jgi:hypothetical protein
MNTAICFESLTTVKAKDAPAHRHKFRRTKTELHPVLSSVLKGKVYTVGLSWWTVVTTRPMNHFGGNKEIIGMLYVGLPEETSEPENFISVKIRAKRDMFMA